MPLFLQMTSLKLTGANMARLWALSPADWFGLIHYLGPRKAKQWRVGVDQFRRQPFGCTVFRVILSTLFGSDSPLAVH